MESDKIKNLEILAGITFKLEFELNRVKDWIKTQLSDAELNGYKNNFQTADDNYGQFDPNLASMNNYAENTSSELFPVNTQQQMTVFSGPVAVTIASVLNKNPSSSMTIESQALETNEYDDEIEIIMDSRTDGPDLITPHILLSSDQLVNPERINNSRNWVEIEEIDPLTITNNKTDKNEDLSVIGASTNDKHKKKRKLKRFNADILKRIKSEQILESAKNWTISRYKNVAKEKKYICPKCSKRFANLYKLKYHLKIHSTSKDYKCKFCSKLYKTYNNMYSHTIQAHRNERNDLPFKCKECGSYFKKESALENHKIEAHIGLKCKYCDIVFYSKLKFFVHTQNNHLICATPDCEMKFLTKDALKLHRRINHPNNRMNFQNLNKS